MIKVICVVVAKLQMMLGYNAKVLGGRVFRSPITVIQDECNSSFRFRGKETNLVNFDGVKYFRSGLNTAVGPPTC